MFCYTNVVDCFVHNYTYLPLYYLAIPHTWYLLERCDLQLAFQAIHPSAVILLKDKHKGHLPFPIIASAWLV